MTVASIELGEEDLIEIRVNQNRIEQAKEIPGTRWNGKRRIFTVPVSWATCVVARGVFGTELEVGPKLAQWARDEYETRIVPSLAAREAKE